MPGQGHDEGAFVTGQLELFCDQPLLSEESLLSYLNEGASRPVSVTLTRNRSTMVSVVVPSHGPIRVRLHEHFLRAEQAVIRALRRYLRTGRRTAWAVVSAYASRIPGDASRPPVLRPLQTKGSVYDLELILKEVNQTFFNGRVKCRIGWGRAVSRRHRRSMRFGSWHAATRTIRVHPFLDDERVPRDFVRYIVFHEMLHAVVPDERLNGKTYKHTRTFRRLENAFPNVKDMRRFCRVLLHLLA
jgi:hypothetical protein